MPSAFTSSSLLVTDRLDGDARLLGEVGDIPLGVWDVEGPSELREFLSGILVSEALLVNLPVPMPFFCLNFSSQFALASFRRVSLRVSLLLFTLVANRWACSVIAASLVASPFLCWFLTQTERVFSTSGNLPLVLFTGDRLRSSGKRYFSFTRRTFDTVLGEV
jgi:hypothetical protein